MTLALDLFCGAGGAAMGLNRAGFDVVGIDINPQPNYPFEFRQLDAMTADLLGFDFIWASPPCQRYSIGTQRWNPEDWPDLVPGVRERLQATGKPYIIENVPGAPLELPVRLCGVMFGLRVVRHRVFESNIPLGVPKHVRHRSPIQRPALDGTDRMVWRSWYMTVAGHGGHSNSYKLSDWAEAMGIDWMSKTELVESIPPAHSEYLGAQVYSMLTN